VIEPRSNTMRLGAHQQQLMQSVADADIVIWYQPEGLDWQLDALVNSVAIENTQMFVLQNIDRCIDAVVQNIEETKQSSVVIMSNGGFGGIHQKLVSRLQSDAKVEVLNV